MAHPIEYRKLFSELLGTFFLVLVAAGGGILHAKGQISLAAAVVAPGLMVLAIILFMGAVSGAHLNPAVSLAFAVRGDFPWKRVPGYIITQLVGATLACLFLLAVFGNIEQLGATLPGAGYHDWQAFLMEIALTAGLLSVILGTASAAQNVGAIGALGVGGYIALAGLWSAPVSGTSMNPARSFGPALVSGEWTAYWVYVAGPLLGAAIAVGCAMILRGRGGDPIAHAAGSGVLPPGRLQEKTKLSQQIDAGEVVPPGLGRQAQTRGPSPGEPVRAQWRLVLASPWRGGFPCHRVDADGRDGDDEDAAESAERVQRVTSGGGCCGLAARAAQQKSPDTR